MKRSHQPDGNSVPAKKKANQLAIDPNTFNPTYPYNAPPLSIQAPFFNSDKGLTQNPPGFLAAKLQAPLTFASDGSIALNKHVLTDVDSSKGLDIDSTGRIYIKKSSPLEFNTSGDLTLNLPPLKVDHSGGLKNTNNGLSIFLAPTSGLQTNSTGLFLLAQTIWTGIPTSNNITTNNQASLFFSITHIGGIAHCLVALKGTSTSTINNFKVLLTFDEEGNLSAQSQYKGTFGKRTSSLGNEENNKKENWAVFMPSKAFYTSHMVTNYCVAPVSIIQKNSAGTSNIEVSTSNIIVALNKNPSSTYSIEFNFTFTTVFTKEYETTLGSFSYVTELPGTLPQP